MEKVERILKTDGARIVKKLSPTQPAPVAQKDAAPDRAIARAMNAPAASHNQAECCNGHASGHEHHGHKTQHQHHDEHVLSEHNHAHEQNNEHAHSHDHSSNRTMIGLLISSAVLYSAASFIPSLNSGVMIGLFLTAMVLSGYTTFIRGLKHLIRLRFTIDALMTIALIGAVGIGEWQEATLVAILFGLNELLEGLGMEKARRSMEALLDIAPKEARLLRNGEETIVPIDTLQAGDTVIVRPGDQIPSDGTIISGISSVNEAAITGEALPVDKTPSDAVFGGSINNEGVLHVQIEKAYEDSSLARMLHLVEEAQETKTPTEQFINHFAKYYTPLILVVAVLVMIVPPLFASGSWMDWLYQGLAVLIVGCPCALILSSPIAILSGITRNARNGVLIKGGVHLEQLGKLDTIAFDKTGTITEGKPHVEKTIVYNDTLFYPIAAAIERHSSHPLAQAVLNEAIKQGGVAVDHGFTLNHSENKAGVGIKAVINNATYHLGSEQSLAQLEIAANIRTAIDQLKADGLTLVVLSDDHHVLGMFGIADRVRDESEETIAALHRNGITNTVMLTGDHPAAAAKVSKQVGIKQVHAALLPEQKVEQVKRLAETGSVAMIGDGINDAPALASAQLGIAMGKGTDAAIETADIILMQDHLGKLPEAIHIARTVNRIIKINITLALGLKLIALLLTIPGLLTLWIAILSDMGATIIVSLLSLTVLIPRRKQTTITDVR